LRWRCESDGTDRCSCWTSQCRATSPRTSPPWRTCSSTPSTTSIEENRRSRREAARQAEAIIELQVEHFLGWWRAADRQGLIREIRARAEIERDQVLARAQQMLAQGKPTDDVLRYLANTLTNKLLHAPSARLRSAAQRGELDLFRAAEQLFSANEATGDDAPTDTP
jgi:glutamyl-tRNA reductase